MFILPIDVVILLLNCLVLILYLYMHFLSPKYFFPGTIYLAYTFSVASSKIHGVQRYFPRLWGMGICDAILCILFTYSDLHIHPLFIIYSLIYSACNHMSFYGNLAVLFIFGTGPA